MIIDGWIVPEDLSITFANGKQNAMDVIAGFNKDEHTSLGGNVAFRDTMAWAMRLFAERQMALGKRAYWYTFTHEPPIEPGARDLKATHASEIVYALDNLWAPRVFPDASSPTLAMASEKDRAMADQMSSVLGELRAHRRPERQGTAGVGALQGSQRAAAHSGHDSGAPERGGPERVRPEYAEVLKNLTSTRAGSLKAAPTSRVRRGRLQAALIVTMR